MKKPIYTTKPNLELPCTCYDEEARLAIIDGSEREDIKDKNVFSYTYYGNYGITHKHDYWEFILILSGNYSHVLNGRSFQVNKNHACLIRPQLDGHCLKNAPQGSKHLTVRIRESYMQQICGGVHEQFYEELLKRPVILFSLSDKQTERIIDYTTVIQNLPVEKSIVPTYFLVTYILEKIAGTSHFFETEKPQWFSELLLEINSPKNMHWSVNDIVENSHFSHTHLLRAFKKYENCSLSDYLAKVKMLHACNLILYSNISILEIALMLGYSDSSHLNRTFKKLYNLSPTQFKRIYKG